jgi:hypothetical protein
MFLANLNKKNAAFEELSILKVEEKNCLRTYDEKRQEYHCTDDQQD